MKPYRNLGGESSVDSYEDSPSKRVRSYRAGKTWIRVKFHNGSIYTYTYQSAGSKNVEMMKILAEAGAGLNSYIQRRVKRMYAKRVY